MSNEILNMDITDGMAMIAKAKEKVNRQEWWEVWIARLPHMDEKSYIPFDEFYNKRNSKTSKSSTPVKHYTKDDVPNIIQMAEKIKETYQNTISQG